MRVVVGERREARSLVGEEGRGERAQFVFWVAGEEEVEKRLGRKASEAEERASRAQARVRSPREVSGSWALPPMFEWTPGNQVWVRCCVGG